MELPAENRRTAPAMPRGRPHRRVRERDMLAPGLAHMGWVQGRVVHIFPSAHKEPQLWAADGGVEQDHPRTETSVPRGDESAQQSDPILGEIGLQVKEAADPKYQGL